MISIKHKSVSEKVRDATRSKCGVNGRDLKIAINTVVPPKTQITHKNKVRYCRNSLSRRVLMMDSLEIVGQDILF
jgi:hypothetical protein